MGGGGAIVFDPRSQLRKAGSWRSMAKEVDWMEKQKQPRSTGYSMRDALVGGFIVLVCCFVHWTPKL